MKPGRADGVIWGNRSWERKCRVTAAVRLLSLRLFAKAQRTASAAVFSSPPLHNITTSGTLHFLFICMLAVFVSDIAARIFSPPPTNVYISRSQWKPQNLNLIS